MKLLVDHWRALVAERTRLASRIRWWLHESDPTLRIPSRALRRQCVVAHLSDRLRGVDGVVARLAREQLDRCRELTGQVNALEREIRGLVRGLAPQLLEIRGCGVLSAAMILGARREPRQSAFSVVVSLTSSFER